MSTTTTTGPGPDFPVLATASKPFLHSPTFWLPESPVHDIATGLTHFADIPSRTIHSFSLTDPATLTTLKVSDYIGALFLPDPASPDHLLAAAQHGLARIHLPTGTLSYLVRYPASPIPLRSNDAAVDPHGRIWVGVMRNFGAGPPQPGDASVYVCSTAGKLTLVRGGMTVPNGIAFSPDGRWAYVVETRGGGTIWRYEVDAGESGVLAGSAVEWVSFKEETHGKGAPDGVAVSEDGDLWVAMFGGGRVLRLDGATGEVKGQVRVEGSRQVACPRFVGRSLVITTGALTHVDEKIREECEWAGDVFVVEDVGVAGREIYRARLDADPVDVDTV